MRYNPANKLRERSMLESKRGTVWRQILHASVGGGSFQWVTALTSEVDMGRDSVVPIIAVKSRWETYSYGISGADFRRPAFEV